MIIVSMSLFMGIMKEGPNERSFGTVKMRGMEIAPSRFFDFFKGAKVLRFLNTYFYIIY